MPPGIDSFHVIVYLHDHTKSGYRLHKLERDPIDMTYPALISKWIRNKAVMRGGWSWESRVRSALLDLGPFLLDAMVPELVGLHEVETPEACRGMRSTSCCWRRCFDPCETLSTDADAPPPPSSQQPLTARSSVNALARLLYLFSRAIFHPSFPFNLSLLHQGLSVFFVFGKLGGLSFSLLLLDSSSPTHNGRRF
jgi:hypothetical protein